MVEGKTGKVVVTPDMVHEFLGRQRFAEAAERIDRPGVVTGLVWTSVGGDIIFVEAAMMRTHESQLTLTGQLGDVMKESAMTALSYVRSNATTLGIDLVSSKTTVCIFMYQLAPYPKMALRQA